MGTARCRVSDCRENAIIDNDGKQTDYCFKHRIRKAESKKVGRHKIYSEEFEDVISTGSHHKAAKGFIQAVGKDSNNPNFEDVDLGSVDMMIAMAKKQSEDLYRKYYHGIDPKIAIYVDKKGKTIKQTEQPDYDPNRFRNPVVLQEYRDSLAKLKAFRKLKRELKKKQNEKQYPEEILAEKKKVQTGVVDKNGAVDDDNWQEEEFRKGYIDEKEDVSIYDEIGEES